MLFEFNNDDIFLEDVDREDNRFYRGNMFDNEFVPYKGMNFLKPKVKGNKEKELLKIMALSFAINDYNLYLDLYPDDKNIFTLYKKAVKDLNELTDSYEKKYGPFMVDSKTYDEFNWLNNPWPWDGDDSKYV